MNLTLGRVVRTSYGTGPFKISRIFGPCTCLGYVGTINGDEGESDQHYHMTAEKPDRPREPYALNGYRDDGTNVWSRDQLFFDDVAEVPRRVEVPRGQSYDLFADLETA